MMDEENIPMDDSCDVEFVCGDPKVDVRVGDEYQVEIPCMISESQREAYLLNPLESSCSFVVGLPVEVMWIDNKKNRDDNVDMNESLRSFKSKRSRRGENEKNSRTKKQRLNLEPVPGRSSSSWNDLEVDGLVLGLYTFGKNFAQVQKLLESKETGQVLSFYYGKFYKSVKHKVWSSNLKKRSRRVIQGKKLYSDWRLHLLLSRLIPSIQDEPKKQKLVNVSKSFAEGKKTLEEYIMAVKELVGLRSLVEAVAIGKDKEDLTVLTIEPVKAKHWFTVSSGTCSGSKPFDSVTVDDIMTKLTGGSRLSKARCNDIFWEFVWPRLLARGWNSLQPDDRAYNKSREHIVFLVPGVKQFSRQDLVKKEHYYDSVSDIIAKVISEPELLEFETADGVKASNGVIQENTCDQSNQAKHRYLKSPRSSSSDIVKFTVVDTTRLASGGKLCEFREMEVPSESKACRGDNNNPSVERSQTMTLNVDKRKWLSKLMLKPVDEPVRFMIVDTSAERGGHSSGIRRRRSLPDSENLCCSAVKEETLVENVQQGCSKKRLSKISESNNHLPLPKRRRLSSCVRNDIKRSGESSELKPPASDQTTKLSADSMKIKTEQSEETEKAEKEPKGLCPISETVHESSSAQQEEPNGFGFISVVLDSNCFSKEQGALHELSSSKQQQRGESNRLCSVRKCSSKEQQERLVKLPPKSASDKNSPSIDHETAQELAPLKQEEEEEEQNQQANGDIPRRQSTRKRLVQLPHKSVSDKNSPSIDHETAQELAPLKQEEEEQNQHANGDIPRRQSTRKRPLTIRALEALESSNFPEKCLKARSKPRKRERSTKIKQGEANNCFLVKEATTSKPLDRVEDMEPSFLVNKATRTSKPVDRMDEDSKKVTTEQFPKLPPIVLKLPFKRS